MSFQSGFKMTRVSDSEVVAFPKGSNRRIAQTLEPIEGPATLRRTVNGTMTVVQNPLFRKYRSSVDCADFTLPSLTLADIGEEFTVECSATLWQTMPAGGSTTLERDPVPGSVQALTSDGNIVAHTLAGRVVSAAGADSVCYRPVLTCILADLSFDDDETSAERSWTIDLEEV